MQDAAAGAPVSERPAGHRPVPPGALEGPKEVAGVSFWGPGGGGAQACFGETRTAVHTHTRALPQQLSPDVKAEAGIIRSHPMRVPPAHRARRVHCIMEVSGVVRHAAEHTTRPSTPSPIQKWNLPLWTKCGSDDFLDPALEAFVPESDLVLLRLDFFLWVDLFFDQPQDFKTEQNGDLRRHMRIRAHGCSQTHMP